MGSPRLCSTFPGLRTPRTLETQPRHRTLKTQIPAAGDATPGQTKNADITRGSPNPGSQPPEAGPPHTARPPHSLTHSLTIAGRRASPGARSRRRGRGRRVHMDPAGPRAPRAGPRLCVFPRLPQPSRVAAGRSSLSPRCGDPGVPSPAAAPAPAPLQKARRARGGAGRPRRAASGADARSQGGFYAAVPWPSAWVVPPRQRQDLSGSRERAARAAPPGRRGV